MARLPAVRQPSPYPWPFLPLPARAAFLLAPTSCPLMPAPCGLKMEYGTEPASQTRNRTGVPP